VVDSQGRSVSTVVDAELEQEIQALVTAAKRVGIRWALDNVEQALKIERWASPFASDELDGVLAVVGQLRQTSAQAL
jgi:hypothetical protein